MFETLSDRLSGVISGLTRQGALTDEDIATALREVRTALLEADVSLPVARSFVKSVTDKARGQSVTRSITPGQQVVKIVHDELVSTSSTGEVTDPRCAENRQPARTDPDGRLARAQARRRRRPSSPNGSRTREGKRVLMASLDTNRPAAMEQLAILGKPDRRRHPAHRRRAKIPVADRAVGPRQQATFGRLRRRICSTPRAGCRSTTDAHRAELAAVRDAVRSARNAARGRRADRTGRGRGGAPNSTTSIGVTGVVLTRMDGDGRGGAALSMRAVTGKPIRFVGMGEKMDALEEPSNRGASRAASLAWAISSRWSNGRRKPSRPKQAERMMKPVPEGAVQHERPQAANWNR